MKEPDFEKLANALRIDLIESPANTAYFMEQVTSALRAQYVAGLKRAVELCDNHRHSLKRIVTLPAEFMADACESCANYIVREASRIERGEGK